MDYYLEQNEVYLYTLFIKRAAKWTWKITFAAQWLNPLVGDRTMAHSVAPKSFFAHLFEDSGVLAKVDGELVFFGDNGDIVTVEPSMINFLTVLGEVGLA